MSIDEGNFFNLLRRMKGSDKGTKKDLTLMLKYMYTSFKGK